MNEPRSEPNTPGVMISVRFHFVFEKKRNDRNIGDR